MTSIKKSIFKIIIFGLLLSSGNAQSKPYFLEIGTLGGAWSDVKGISGDGGTVVGDSTTTSGKVHAFVWRFKGKMLDIGKSNPGPSFATAASVKGDTVVGWASPIDTQNTNTDLPFYWRGASLNFLKPLGGSGGTGRAWGVSGNGSLIVGESTTSSGALHATLWNIGGGAVDLGSPKPGSNSSAFAISEDGSTVVGLLDLSQPLVWRVNGSATQMETLPLSGGAAGGIAMGVNVDGSIISGFANTNGVYQAVLWTRVNGQWAISFVDAYPIVEQGSNVGAALQGAGFYGVAGVAGNARAIGIGGASWPAEAVFADVNGAVAKWTDVNFITGLTPKPLGRKLHLGIGISRNGSAIAGASLAAPGLGPDTSRGYFIIGLSSMPVPPSKKSPVHISLEITCKAPCFSVPPFSKEQIEKFKQWAWRSDLHETGPKLLAPRLRLMMERQMKALSSEISH